MTDIPARGLLIFFRENVPGLLPVPIDNGMNNGYSKRTFNW